MNKRLNCFKLLVLLIILAIATCPSKLVYAQCGTPISTFPYNEGFELTNGGWFSGGSLSDWAWGAPTKPVINSAATGTKCWIVGGLSGGGYNDAEASWLQSPCFNFTSLQYPYISFNVFWEMEQKFDGGGFQYSTDLGVTWNNVGSVNGTTNCLNENWFNYTPIQYIGALATVKDGWSGNIQTSGGGCQIGGGSGRWLNAKQTMPYLAGKPNVIFRFIFGAGTICNNYDGFAIDDISISEAPANNAAFTYSCTNSNTVAFKNTSALCPTATNWNFGDGNTSTQTNPTHTFASPGTYTITLTVGGPDNAPSTTSQTINILGLATQVITNNNCFGDNNGSATVNVIPVSAAPFFYSWNTTPAQNIATATGLAAGTYTVTVNAINSCTATATAIITSPPALTHSLQITQPGCGAATGSVTINESGGTAPYQYTWFPSGGNASSASGLAAGNYSVTVTDSKSCSEIIKFSIFQTSPPSVNITNKKDASCAGSNDGFATAQASGGTAPYSYVWNTTPAQNTATASNLVAGNYTVTITDNNNCHTTASVQIKESAGGNCGDVYFPNAFTPNNDLKNDGFGALGNISAISNYKLVVFNRYGETIFSTNNPTVKWNGFYKNKMLEGNFVWWANYTFKNSQKREEKGSVLILR